ncbi:hypothetical protein TVAG_180360 [Trichomonas vaginalis G3]|uniref:Myb-like domain-containing protein n=1 Tax=Trichomonas vaginalis (strain ATCC PRA-98 / G3) TaxID=412133 RepID=A2EE65_TRIV3|nr:SANT/myb-like telomere repeat binding factor-like DNA-binding domain-containing protein [Trichomonas vaginalis G3]EAY09062.1 hypothetical protein TVAG_180360 [Trichomonas vaginalis G3]KAI5503422.1 SANT/myb-like telomere repeat binding factor-like DNA-binding domain-containing protein [Trichomonas vaginalis G3]|eukprot:XP_001321285.1 hypothetical protein [Trichomonas vaginalis G3]
MKTPRFTPTEGEIKQFQNQLLRRNVQYTEILEGFSELIALGEIQQTEIPDFKGQTTQENAKPEKKRSGIPWTKEEVDAIEDGIKKFGLGKWAKIYEYHKDIFLKNDRRSGDIGDKWKNLKNKPNFQKYLVQPPVVPASTDKSRFPPNVVTIAPNVTIITSTKQSVNTPIPQPKVILPQILRATATLNPSLIPPKPAMQTNLQQNPPVIRPN